MASVGLGFVTLLLLGFGSRKHPALRLSNRTRLLLLSVVFLSALPFLGGCGTDFLYSKYLVTATPSPAAADQTPQTHVVWVKSQVGLAP